MFHETVSGDYSETPSTVVHLNIAAPSLRMPFDVAGQYLIANAGYKEVHAAPSEKDAQAILQELEEQSRRWAGTQPAAKIIPLF